MQRNLFFIDDYHSHLYSFVVFFSEYNDHYLGIQRQARTNAQNLNSAIVGPKEDTSRVIMEKGFEQKFDDPRRFFTNYQTK